MNLVEKNITIGTDPELFIFDTVANKVISSIGIIPGLKGEAYQPEGFPDGFGLQIDNILAEFNIPPVQDVNAWIANLNKMKEYIRDFVKKVNPNYDILCCASMLIDEDQLQSDEAKEFGCMPDYNCYTEDVNPKPEGEATNLRTTGFHVHVGYPFADIEQQMKMLKCMDLFLGVPSILIDPDSRRRELYGKAGCFRLTSYGVEYRTLSGFFLGDDKLSTWVYENTVKAIEYFESGNEMPNEADVIKAINTNDVELARSIVEKFNVSLA